MLMSTAALRTDTPVILMHDVPRNTYTLEALPWIIDTLRANGYRLDVVSNIKAPVQHRNPDRDTPPAPSKESRHPSSGSSSPDSSHSESITPESSHHPSESSSDSSLSSSSESFSQSVSEDSSSSSSESESSLSEGEIS